MSWLEADLFQPGLGGGHPPRLFDLLRLLFLCNSTVLIQLGVHHELDNLVNEGIKRI